MKISRIIILVLVLGSCSSAPMIDVRRFPSSIYVVTYRAYPGIYLGDNNETWRQFTFFGKLRIDNNNLEFVNGVFLPGMFHYRFGRSELNTLSDSVFYSNSDRVQLYIENTT